jgi:uncharacterized protein YjiS (DUF1127 family)
MKTSILALAMGVALLWIGIASTPRRCRTVTTLCLRRRVPAMRDSHDSISDFPANETTQIAMIVAIYEFARSSFLILGGSMQCENRMSGSPIPNLPLPGRSHHFAVQQTDKLLEQNRNKKMISLKTISEKLNARRRYRAAVSELSKLSDHELSDIGISRGDIEYVARRPVASKASA